VSLKVANVRVDVVVLVAANVHDHEYAHAAEFSA
jgi:hypothetical protein